MENRQEFWENLKRQYEDKNKILQQKELELRFKLDAMSCVIGDGKPPTTVPSSKLSNYFLPKSSINQPAPDVHECRCSPGQKSLLGSIFGFFGRETKPDTNASPLVPNPEESTKPMNPEPLNPNPQADLCACNITTPDEYCLCDVCDEHPPGTGGEIPMVAEEKLPTKKLSNLSKLCLCNTSTTAPEAVCNCDICLPPRTLPGTALDKNLTSLQSLDLNYMKNIHELATHQKDLLKEVAALEKKAEIYENVLSDYRKEPAARADKPPEAPERNNAELRLENILLKNELKDMRMEVRQYLERMEGPMQYKIESERYRCQQLQDELESAQHELVKCQELFRQQLNNLNLELCTAHSTVFKLNGENEAMQQALLALQAKSSQLEDDLIKTKISEGETLKKLQSYSVKVEDPVVGSPEDCELLEIARAISSVLKECEPCTDCATWPEDLTSTAKLLKELSVMVEGKIMKEEQTIPELLPRETDDLCSVCEHSLTSLINLSNNLGKLVGVCDGEYHTLHPYLNENHIDGVGKTEPSPDLGPCSCVICETAEPGFEDLGAELVQNQGQCPCKVEVVPTAVPRVVQVEELARKRASSVKPIAPSAGELPASGTEEVIEEAKAACPCVAAGALPEGEAVEEADTDDKCICLPQRPRKGDRASITEKPKRKSRCRCANAKKAKNIDQLWPASAKPAGLKEDSTTDRPGSKSCPCTESKRRSTPAAEPLVEETTCICSICSDSGLAKPVAGPETLVEETKCVCEMCPLGGHGKGDAGPEPLVEETKCICAICPEPEQAQPTSAPEALAEETKCICAICPLAGQRTADASPEPVVEKPAAPGSRPCGCPLSPPVDSLKPAVPDDRCICPVCPAPDTPPGALPEPAPESSGDKSVVITPGGGAADHVWLTDSASSAMSAPFKLQHHVTASRSREILKSETSVKCTRDPFPFDVDTHVDVLNRASAGVQVTTTITASGTLEVITEGPEGVIETTLIYTKSGNVEILTEVHDPGEFNLGLKGTMSEPGKGTRMSGLPIEAASSGPAIVNTTKPGDSLGLSLQVAGLPAGAS